MSAYPTTLSTTAPSAAPLDKPVTLVKIAYNGKDYEVYGTNRDGSPLSNTQVTELQTLLATAVKTNLLQDLLDSAAEAQSDWKESSTNKLGAHVISQLTFNQDTMTYTQDGSVVQTTHTLSAQLQSQVNSHIIGYNKILGSRTAKANAEKAVTTILASSDTDDAKKTEFKATAITAFTRISGDPTKAESLYTTMLNNNSLDDTCLLTNTNTLKTALETALQSEIEKLPSYDATLSPSARELPVPSGGIQTIRHIWDAIFTDLTTGQPARISPPTPAQTSIGAGNNIALRVRDSSPPSPVDPAGSVVATCTFGDSAAAPLALPLLTKPMSPRLESLVEKVSGYDDKSKPSLTITKEEAAPFDRQFDTEISGTFRSQQAFLDQVNTSLGKHRRITSVANFAATCRERVIDLPPAMFTFFISLRDSYDRSHSMDQVDFLNRHFSDDFSYNDPISTTDYLKYVYNKLSRKKHLLPLGYTLPDDQTQFNTDSLQSMLEKMAAEAGTWGLPDHLVPLYDKLVAGKTVSVSDSDVNTLNIRYSQTFASRDPISAREYLTRFATKLREVDNEHQIEAHSFVPNNNPALFSAADFLRVVRHAHGLLTGPVPHHTHPVPYEISPSITNTRTLLTSSSDVTPTEDLTRLLNVRFREDFTTQLDGSLVETMNAETYAQEVLYPKMRRNSQHLPRDYTLPRTAAEFNLAERKKLLKSMQIDDNTYRLRDRLIDQIKALEANANVNISNEDVDSMNRAFGVDLSTDGQTMSARAYLDRVFDTLATKRSEIKTLGGSLPTKKEEFSAADFLHLARVATRSSKKTSKKRPLVAPRLSTPLAGAAGSSAAAPSPSLKGPDWYRQAPSAEVKTAMEALLKDTDTDGNSIDKDAIITQANTWAADGAIEGKLGAPNVQNGWQDHTAFLQQVPRALKKDFSQKEFEDLKRAYNASTLFSLTHREEAFIRLCVLPQYIPNHSHGLSTSSVQRLLNGSAVGWNEVFLEPVAPLSK